MHKKKSDDPVHLLTIKHVAEICRVSEKTIRRLIEARDLEASKVGSQLRIHPRDLEKFRLDGLIR